ncbi:uncharacterized protein Dana_GF16923 [Drosophila ananassae]|uniref:Major facilitator superfamily (MFS) profile domain-containing protein n=1 Tax=Drosophila ananassae TaxID=7217 RepID=B3LW58_DROAN|nr:sialin [Drosophila ananassae]EDV42636.1 uncharacterized protein Dana_GF16923 [Drosophila ananassae]
MSCKSWTLPRMSQSGPSTHSLLNSVRLTYALCAFLNCFLHAAMRNMLGMIILKMVKPRPEDHLETASQVAQQLGEYNVTTTGRCGDYRLGPNPIVQVPQTGDLHWTRNQELTFPGIYYYGYVVSLFLAGHLADRYSSKRILILSLALTALVYILLPLMAHYSFEAAAANLVICGILAGGGNPAMYKLFVIWAHPTERTSLIAFAYSGILIGSLMIFPLAGFLSEFFWELPFYVLGSVSLIFGIICFWLIYDNLDQHPRISKTELDYLQQGVVVQTNPTAKVPWKKLLSSLPVYSFIMTHVFHNYTFLVLAILMPRLMREAMEFDLRHVGVFSSIPFLGACCSKAVCILGGGYLERRMGSQQNWIRRLLYVISCIVTISCTIVIIMSDCGNKMLVLFMFSLLMCFSDMGFGIYWPTLLYFGPSFAGLISGVANGLAHLSGFLAPQLVASLVHTGSKPEWNMVLLSLVAFNIMALLVFGLCSSTNLQPWDPRSNKAPTRNREAKENNS